MTVSATDDPVIVTISENGRKGDPGTDGTNGEGFNQVRKSLLDNPLCWLYKKNDLVRNLTGLLTVNRSTGGSYTNIYGVVTAASSDEPREEIDGWKITSDETHTFNVDSNIPNLNDGFTCIIELGYYLGGAVSQDIISIPTTANTLFVVGTDSSGNFSATIRGSGGVDYEISSSTSSTVSTYTNIIVTYFEGDFSIYINGVLEATLTLPTGQTDVIDPDGTATINGNYTMNLRGVRFYDFIVNSDEITFLN